MSDYPMLISNKLHSFRNFYMQIYKTERVKSRFCKEKFTKAKFLTLGCVIKHIII